MEIKLFEQFFFQRIRRITGYLTGDLKTWNDAKKAEEKDRVKHGSGGKKDGASQATRISQRASEAIPL